MTLAKAHRVNAELVCIGSSRRAISITVRRTPPVHRRMPARCSFGVDDACVACASGAGLTGSYSSCGAGGTGVGVGWASPLVVASSGTVGVASGVACVVAVAVAVGEADAATARCCRALSPLPLSCWLLL